MAADDQTPAARHRCDGPEATSFCSIWFEKKRPPQENETASPGEQGLCGNSQFRPLSFSLSAAVQSMLNGAIDERGPSGYFQESLLLFFNSPFNKVALVGSQMGLQKPTVSTDVRPVRLQQGIVQISPHQSCSQRTSPSGGNLKAIGRKNRLTVRLDVDKDYGAGNEAASRAKPACLTMIKHSAVFGLLWRFDVNKRPPASQRNAAAQISGRFRRHEPAIH